MLWTAVLYIFSNQKVKKKLTFELNDVIKTTEDRPKLVTPGNNLS